MKKQFNSLKRIIATLLLATILCTSITSNATLYSDTISTFSARDRSDSDGFPHS